MRRPTVLVLMLAAISGCQAKRAPAPPAAGPDAVFRAYLNAVTAGDRDRIRTLVLLPDDPKRRQWVLNFVADAELPPAGTKFSSPSVQMDGPVAVCRAASPPAEAPLGPVCLVRRDGRWRIVIDFFEGSGLTRDELRIIGRHLFPNEQEEDDDEE